jgi:hypothetical protein
MNILYNIVVAIHETITAIHKFIGWVLGLVGWCCVITAAAGPILTWYRAVTCDAIVTKYDFICELAAPMLLIGVPFGITGMAILFLHRFYYEKQNVTLNLVKHNVNEIIESKTYSD